MSNESLVLLALLFLLPLAQQLLEGARQRSRSRSAPAERPPLGVPLPQPRPVSPPPVLIIPPRFEMDDEPFEQTTVREGPAARGRPGVATPPPPRRSWRQTTVRSLRTRLGLRRALVLTAVIGPCRAVEPHGSAGGAGRRSP